MTTTKASRADVTAAPCHCRTELGGVPVQREVTLGTWGKDGKLHRAPARSLCDQCIARENLWCTTCSRHGGVLVLSYGSYGRDAVFACLKCSPHRSPEDNLYAGLVQPHDYSSEPSHVLPS